MTPQVAFGTLLLRGRQRVLPFCCARRNSSVANATDTAIVQHGSGAGSDVIYSYDGALYRVPFVEVGGGRGTGVQR